MFRSFWGFAGKAALRGVMRKVSLIYSLCWLLIAIAPTLAQGAKQKSAVPKPTDQAPASAAPAAETLGESRISVEGFRSAKFGMNEADVRLAIGKDFGLKAEAIKTQDNPAELTHSLLVTVPDLLPNGGGAEVSYVLGYKSKSLIQVGAVWSKATDSATTPERLFSNANILRAHFLGEGFKPDTVAVNTPVNGGLLMFRGSDAKDHTVMLLLQGTFETRDNNQRALTPTGLLLFYIADAKSPDVFKLPPGQF
jgi:hypothetical protein